VARLRQVRRERAPSLKRNWRAREQTQRSAVNLDDNSLTKRARGADFHAASSNNLSSWTIIVLIVPTSIANDFTTSYRRSISSETSRFRSAIQREYVELARFSRQVFLALPETATPLYPLRERRILLNNGEFANVHAACSYRQHVRQDCNRRDRRQISYIEISRDFRRSERSRADSSAIGSSFSCSPITPIRSLRRIAVPRCLSSRDALTLSLIYALL